MSTATSTRYEAHRNRCEQEATRDVIFLLQSKRLTWTGILPRGVQWDGENCLVWKDGADKDKDSPITLSQLHRDYGSEYVFEQWLTQGVWLDRDEAEAWGKSHHYRYEDGWRVYGVCAEGELAKLLRGEP